MRILLRSAMALLAAILVLDLLYFVRGSLEMFPTAEDNAKVRIVTGAIGIVLMSTLAAARRMLRA